LPVAVIAVGYKGDNENLSPALKQRITSPRVRKEVRDFVIEV
jgi:hypothetical protein